MGDELVEILNGIVREERSRGRERPRMYYNQAGEPTDDFLEAVRSEAAVGLPRPSHRHYADEEDGYLSSEREAAEWRRETRFKPTIRSRRSHHPVTRRTIPSEVHDEHVHRSHRRVRRRNTINQPAPSEEPAYMRPIKPPSTDKVYSSSTTEKAINPLVSLLAAHESGQDARSSDLEGKVTTLKLRLQGQQSTLRALEAKVSELTAMVEIKDKEIASLSKKQRPVDSKEQSKIQSNIRNLDTKKYEDALDKLRTEKKLLMDRVIEEQNKLKRAEDRTREMKEYADKAKLLSHQVEIRNQDQLTIIEEMKSKLTKYRRESKEFNTKLALVAAKAEEKESELKILREKWDLMEKKLKEVLYLIQFTARILTYFP